MENRMWSQFIDFIAAYLLRGDGMLFVEVDDEGHILNYNNALVTLSNKDIIKAVTKLDSLFKIKYLNKSKLDGIDCDNIELYLQNESAIKLNGYCLKKGESSLYIAENDKCVSEKLFEQMDEINLELSNLTREINKKNLNLKQKNQIITEMMYQDTLTKLNNRRYLYEQFAILKDRYAYNEIKKLILVITDIDHFKSVNDTFGHDVGDNVLIKFSDLIRQSTRDIDLKIRFGGDEFMIVFVDTEMSVVKERLELLMYEFSNIQVVEVDHKFSASFGVVEFDGSEEFESFAKRADNALYRAKGNGRDGYVIE